jgi:uncharacterized protein (TIGR03086 family)
MTIEKSVLVPLDAEQTFALLTEPDRLRRWMGISSRIDLRAGGAYRWTVVPGAIAEGTFTEVEPGRRVVFTWGWVGNEGVPPGSSTVTVTLEPADGGTTVTLVHDGLAGDQEAGHLDGWTHYLERLVVAAETGDAGVDTWMAPTAESLDPLTAAEASLALCQLMLRSMGPNDGKAQTPCAKYDVDQLVDHLMGSIVGLAGAVGVTVVPDESAPAEVRVAAGAQQLLEGWRRRGLEGTVNLGPGDMPAELASSILTIEFLVHGWDFARATGQEMPADEVLGAYALELAQGLIAPNMRDGDRFANEVLVGPDADAVTRLVAFTGRSA